MKFALVNRPADGPVRSGDQSNLERLDQAENTLRFSSGRSPTFGHDSRTALPRLEGTLGGFGFHRCESRSADWLGTTPDGRYQCAAVGLGA
jgi:hypothetical protein